ncbi:hypothetical protein T265_12386 [Opisthorchis viverrini]|uniref:Uncharacterized protein n=1 Tax=Opisthorchis viverrini TaxID=6198 RepID=A0A074ZRX4_OPIVI|nr:hypothetical protein T265_12386 [Opisthorchis viverrini]KER18059.1 hypothetical protein T265_12386 [Opisthorchis viverrini]
MSPSVGALLKGGEKVNSFDWILKDVKHLFWMPHGQPAKIKLVDVGQMSQENTRSSIYGSSRTDNNEPDAL